MTLNSSNLSSCFMLSIASMSAGFLLCYFLLKQKEIKVERNNEEIADILVQRALNNAKSLQPITEAFHFLSLRQKRMYFPGPANGTPGFFLTPFNAAGIIGPMHILCKHGNDYFYLMAVQTLHHEDGTTSNIANLPNGYLNSGNTHIASRARFIFNKLKQSKISSMTFSEFKDETRIASSKYTYVAKKTFFDTPGKIFNVLNVDNGAYIVIHALFTFTLTFTQTLPELISQVDEQSTNIWVNIKDITCFKTLNNKVTCDFSYNGTHYSVLTKELIAEHILWVLQQQGLCQNVESNLPNNYSTNEANFSDKNSGIRSSNQ